MLSTTTAARAFRPVVTIRPAGAPMRDNRRESKPQRRVRFSLAFAMVK